MISIGVVARAVGIAHSGSPEKPWASLDSSCLGTCRVASHRMGLDVHEAKRSVEEPTRIDWPRLRSLGMGALELAVCICSGSQRSRQDD